MPASLGNKWKIDHLRFTAFCDRAQPAGWWSKLAGSEPESTSVRRAAGETVEDGPWREQFALRIQTQLNRFHLVLLPRTERMPLEPEAFFDDPDSALAEWSALVSRWMETTESSIHRIAYGVHGTRQASGHAEAYARLQEELPFLTLDLSRARDFTFQINVPNRVGDTATEINRIAKWLALRAQSIPSSPGPMVAEAFFNRLELDISTSADSSEAIDREQLPTIFKSLLSNGHQLMTEGGACLHQI